MNYHNITHDDMNNGSGLRVVLWLSGCVHSCKECQNPQTWNPNSGILFDECAKQEVFTELKKGYISGITLTGGDPLHKQNLPDVLSLIREIREKFPDKSIWLYTGYSLDFLRNQYTRYRYVPFVIDTDEWLLRWEIVSLCDVLVDGPYIEEQRDLTLKWRGSANQRVIDVKKSMEQCKVVLYCD